MLLCAQIFFLLHILECEGKRDDPVERIVGGSPEVIENIPWAVQINIKHDYGTDLCGGALISPQFVISGKEK